MAIRFVDVEPEKAAGPADAAPSRRARAPDAHPRPAPAADAPRAAAEPDVDLRADPRAGEPAADAPLPGLTHAKPEPKPRGRKKPMSATGADRPDRADRKPAPAPEAPEASLLDGLLPELQAHAKPTPKPRGRKKAFG